MSLLIVNSLIKDAAICTFDTLSAKVSDMMRRARLAQLPIAHLHQGAGEVATVLSVPIGRYDPVFRAADLRDEVPIGLIEFIVNSPDKVINLAGAARQTQFDRLTDLLVESGFDVRVLSAAWMSLDERATPQCSQ